MEVASWLLRDGWEVFSPTIDHGKKTDLVIADDTSYYRLQVKTTDSIHENVVVDNKWAGSSVDFVIYFSRTAPWGYITPAFVQQKKRLNAKGHIRFHQHPKSFLKAFSCID